MIVAGTKLSRYEIRSKIGEGGMGEVYRARDAKLNRDVAIKVLPPTYSQDAQRLRRFAQEAQAAGTLNHPNILAVYDVGTHDDAPYVVSELLEGASLKDRLREGPIAQRKAINYAIQAAHGLAAAHEKGIVHRDIKPDNLFITKDDRVKILDFGIAKLIEPVGDGIAQTDVATRKVHTDPGSVIGTAGYMSPEQVRGRAVDYRSDIFSFGAVLYEMLSGQRAFRGESVVETLNSILKDEPKEIATSDGKISPAMERVCWHCLEKSPERRFQSATDIAFALETLSDHSGSTATMAIASAPSRPVNRARSLWISAGILLLITAAALAFAYLSRRQTATHSAMLSLAMPDTASLPARVTVSPDGLRLCFLANNSEGKRVLWLRPLNSLSAQQLAGTEGATSPFWSPDSRFVGFFAGGKLLKVEAAGGRPQTICDASEDRGGTWSRDGVILFSGNEGLYRVSDNGGTPAQATRIDPEEEAHRWPYFLPDGRHFVFLADAATAEHHHIRVGSLDSQDSQILIPAISRVAYAPPGYLLYVNQGALVAQGFDAGALKITGEPVTVAEQVAEVGGNHEFDFSVSEGGVLAYQLGNPDSQLAWFDRTGKKLSNSGEPARYSYLSLSPDKRRAALGLLDTNGRVDDVWLMEIERQSVSRLTFDPHGDGTPVWSPDGSRVVFGSNRLGGGQINLYEKAASGVGDDQLLLQSDAEKFATSWSRDGQFILFNNIAAKAKMGVWVLPLSGDRQPKPLLQTTAFNHADGQFSPDGRFIAYNSNESGRWEVYVQSFPPSGGKWPISSGGGLFPLWRADGKELFYVTQDGRLMSAEVKVGGAFESGVPQQLFQTSIKTMGHGYCYDAAADGQRFIVNTTAEATHRSPMTVILNWTSDLERQQ